MRDQNSRVEALGVIYEAWIHQRYETLCIFDTHTTLYQELLPTHFILHGIHTLAAPSEGTLIQTGLKAEQHHAD